jgi:PPK2 family polyphosphate:nucleotide phosphotransferase
VPAGGKFSLRRVDPADTRGVAGKKKAKTSLAAVQERLIALQEVLYAQGRHALLVVFQAMDTGGKDSTIRRVFGPLNPQGVRVTSFKAPTPDESAHDYLWRIHRAVPPKGMIGIFNRSHYEDVIVARVRGLVPARQIGARYGQINAFEKYLSENAVTILKFYLHIGKQEQKARLQARLDRPDKRWKFDPADLAERERWDEYVAAYERAFRRCTTPYAPWYVVPAEKKWCRDLVVARIVLHALEGLDLRFPETGLEPDRIVIDE